MSEMGKANGPYRSSCAVAETWDEHRREAQDAMEKVGEIYDHMSIIRNNTKHLEKLNQLDVIAAGVTEMKSSLINAVVGKKQIEAPTVYKMLWILGGVIAGLMFVIVFLLTGEKWNIPLPLYK